jgi:hypothetical protein
MPYSLGEIPLPFELDESYWKWVESLRKQDSSGKPDVPVLKYYEPEPLPVKPPTGDISFISPAPFDNYILPKPVAPVTDTPVGGVAPVSEEKKDEKKDEKKKFPWWVVIVGVVVVLFFMMKK